MAYGDHPQDEIRSLATRTLRDPNKAYPDRFPGPLSNAGQLVSRISVELPIFPSGADRGAMQIWDGGNVETAFGFYCVAATVRDDTESRLTVLRILNLAGALCGAAGFVRRMVDDISDPAQFDSLAVMKAAAEYEEWDRLDAADQATGITGPELGRLPLNRARQAELEGDLERADMHYRYHHLRTAEAALAYGSFLERRPMELGYERYKTEASVLYKAAIRDRPQDWDQHSDEILSRLNKLGVWVDPTFGFLDGNVADELEKLSGLRKLGSLTQDEFDAAKARLQRMN